MISASAVQALREMATKFLPQTKIPEAHGWRKLTDDDLWKRTVYQVAVVGSSSSFARLKASEQTQRALNYEHLRGLKTIERGRTINEILRTNGVRYASSDISKCRKTAAVVRNFELLSTFPGGPRAYFESLAMLPDDDTRVVRLERDMSYIKLKGARDLLAELGLVTDMIAFDVRVLNILRSAGVELAPDVQTNHSRYTQLQDALLTQVCLPIGITGVAFDRLMYQNNEQIVPTLLAGNA